MEEIKLISGYAVEVDCFGSTRIEKYADGKLQRIGFHSVWSHTSFLYNENDGTPEIVAFPDTGNEHEGTSGKVYNLLSNGKPQLINAPTVQAERDCSFEIISMEPLKCEHSEQRKTSGLPVIHNW